MSVTEFLILQFKASLYALPVVLFVAGVWLFILWRKYKK